MELSYPLDLIATLAPLRRGPSDPTHRIGKAQISRATNTPVGPATIHVSQAGRLIEAEAWGPGADWALEHLDELIGGKDQDAVIPRHPIIERLVWTLRGVRMTRTFAVFEALFPAILEQKVTSREAHASFSRIVRRYGEAAPGPFDLMLQPTAEVLAELPYFAFHPLGVERKRAETIRLAASRISSLECTSDEDERTLGPKLLSFLGIGPWTAAEVTRLAFGDPDAVSVGDFHLPHLVSWALAGEPRGDDRRMLELLEPYAGQRAKVVRLLEVGGPRPPAFGPRMPVRSFRSI